MNNLFQPYKVVRAILLLIFLSSSPYCLFSQSTVQSELGFDWINVGIGATQSLDGNEQRGAIGAIHSTQFDNSRTILSFRLLYTQPVLNLRPESEGNVWDIGVLYGLRNKSPRVLTSFSAGLGFISEVTESSFKYYTIGVPVNSQLFITPSKNFGLGFNVFANINLEESYIGSLLCIQFGRIH